MKVENIVEIILVVCAIVFGYGVLNSRVNALEANEMAAKEQLIHISKDITSIKEDVSFIKGKLERK